MIFIEQNFRRLELKKIYYKILDVETNFRFDFRL